MKERPDDVPRLLIAPQEPVTSEGVMLTASFGVKVREAVRAAGGAVVGDGKEADGLIWLSGHEGLEEILASHPEVRWVQLALAGEEAVVEASMMSDRRFADITWTSANRSYAKPVAEYALALALAGLRHLPERARARSWGRKAVTTLYGADVTILGGGVITEELLRLLVPFGARATVICKRPEPVAGAAHVLASDQLDGALPGALVVFVALALVPETIHVIGARQFALMGRESWLVNVGCGCYVDTDALVEALQEGCIGGAALDVTDPEPLPDGHPLWSLPNCLITPHTAKTEEMIRRLLAEHIKENVGRFAAGLPLSGVVGQVATY